MFSGMENKEQSNNKIQVGAKVDPAVFSAITQLATEDERSVSNTIERILKQNPQVKELIEADEAAAAN